jgi:hypothetical protein
VLRIGGGARDEKSVTAAGAEALASLVRTFGRVVEGLHLEVKFAGPTGVAALAEALRELPATEHAGHYEAGAAGMAALGEALRAGNCPQLQCGLCGDSIELSGFITQKPAGD